MPTRLVGPPAVPASLTAESGDGQVVLAWAAPASDGGESISGYEYRQSEDGGTSWQPDWTAIKDSNAKTIGHPVTDLTNDTAYTFEVRAVKFNIPIQQEDSRMLTQLNRLMALMVLCALVVLPTQAQY